MHYLLETNPRKTRVMEACSCVCLKSNSSLVNCKYVVCLDTVRTSLVVSLCMNILLYIVGGHKPIYDIYTIGYWCFFNAHEWIILQNVVLRYVQPIELKVLSLGDILLLQIQLGFFFLHMYIVHCQYFIVPIKTNIDISFTCCFTK